MFDVPDPRHECVIVLTQALWQGKLSERYASRLRELNRDMPDSDSLPDFFAKTFGVRENLLNQLADPTLVPRLAAAVRRRTFLQPARLLRSFGYVRDDFARLSNRLKSPPGIVLRSIGASETDLNGLRNQLAILFPLKKGFGCSERADDSAIRKALFKGGLIIESWPASNRPANIVRQPWREPARSFAALREPDGNAHCAHVGSGAMSSSPDFARGLAHFICSVLAGQFTCEAAPRQGTFIVLAGLDGSGKTTLARNLALLATRDKIFAGMRYFHWLPSVSETFEFPLPEAGNQPRHKQVAGGLVGAMFSAARLMKNLLRTRLAFWLWLRPRLRRGYLVLVDRYFYNYHLDPASVKYSGPKWLLAFVEKWFPQPDAVIRLRAPTEVLLRRKQELSAAEIVRQAASLDALTFGDARVISADASRPADELARETLAQILKAVP